MKSDDFETMSLTDLIRLQNELSEIVVRRFETTLALVFSDIVKSTEYFARFGNEAGRKLQQRHFDLLDQVVRKHGSRIVDTAGDGGFSCFHTADQAAEAAVELQVALCKENINRERDYQLVMRIGIHYRKFLPMGCSLLGMRSISARGSLPLVRVQRSTLPGRPLRSCLGRVESAAEL